VHGAGNSDDYELHLMPEGLQTQPQPPSFFGPMEETPVFSGTLDFKLY
jgi:hypothetical protein